jgi:hypothetical protein
MLEKTFKMKTCLLLVGDFFNLVAVRAEAVYSALMKNLTAEKCPR